MLQVLTELLAQESGVTAVEYGLIAALVSVAGVAALTAMGSSLHTLFTGISDTLDSAVTP